MKKPAAWEVHSAGLAIRSPRGMGDPHDIAPRGSQHSELRSNMRPGQASARACRVLRGDCRKPFAQRQRMAIDRRATLGGRARDAQARARRSEVPRYGSFSWPFLRGHARGGRVATRHAIPQRELRMRNTVAAHQC